jgi:hypothetical protein
MKGQEIAIFSTMPEKRTFLLAMNEQPASMQSLPQDKRQLILGWLSRTDERTFVVFYGSRCLSIIIFSGEVLCRKTK